MIRARVLHVETLQLLRHREMQHRTSEANNEVPALCSGCVRTGTLSPVWHFYGQNSSSPLLKVNINSFMTHETLQSVYIMKERSIFFRRNKALVREQHGDVLKQHERITFHHLYNHQQLQIIALRQAVIMIHKF